MGSIAYLTDECATKEGTKSGSKPSNHYYNKLN